MRKKIMKYLVTILLFLTIILGCKNPTGPTPTPTSTPTPTPSEGTITGVIVDSAGGAAVSNTSVELQGTGLSARSDANGEFTITNVPVGIYDLFVSKPGMAGSKLQAVEIYDKETTEVEIIQTLYSFDSSSVTPPTIYGNGISPGNSYNGVVSITVNVTAGSNPVIGTYDHYSIYLKIGSNTGYRSEAVSNTDILAYSWNTYNYPSGDINIQIVAYDNNNNRSELNIPVVVNNSSGVTPSSAPTVSDHEIYAITFGQSLRLFMLEREALLYKSSLNNIKDFITLENGKEINLLSAPADSTALVDYWVNAQPDVTGINVYRSSSVNGSYMLAGKTTYYDSYWNQYNFTDTSSMITPGQSLWYKTSYFNEYGNGPVSDPIEVRILPKYNLNLTAPANNSTITDITPTFQWSSGTITDANRLDYVSVKEVTGEIAWESTYLENQTQVVCGVLLSYNKLYEWNVMSQYQYVSGPVVSLSFPNTSNISNNGAYYFTVILP